MDSAGDQASDLGTLPLGESTCKGMQPPLYPLELLAHSVVHMNTTETVKSLLTKGPCPVNPWSRWLLFPCSGKSPCLCPSVSKLACETPGMLPRVGGNQTCFHPLQPGAPPACPGARFGLQSLLTRVPVLDNQLRYLPLLLFKCLLGSRKRCVSANVYLKVA